MSSPACADGYDTPAQQREDSTTFMVAKVSSTMIQVTIITPSRTVTESEPESRASELARAARPSLWNIMIRGFHSQCEISKSSNRENLTPPDVSFFIETMFSSFFSSNTSSESRNPRNVPKVLCTCPAQALGRRAARSRKKKLPRAINNKTEPFPMCK